MNQDNEYKQKQFKAFLKELEDDRFYKRLYGNSLSSYTIDYLTNLFRRLHNED